MLSTAVKRVSIAAVASGVALMLAPASASAQTWNCTSGGYNGACPNSGYPTPDYKYPNISGSDGYNTDLQADWWNCPSSYCGNASRYRVELQADTPAEGGRWQVVADQPAGNTAVNGYPDLQQVYTMSNNTGPRISSYWYIRSRWSISQPDQRGDDYEAAFDIWLDVPGSPSHHNEIMIWTDNWHQTPAGSVTGHAQIYGRKFTVWANYNTVSFVLDRPGSYGLTHILATLTWLVSHHYIPADTGIGLIGFGWEICSTHGVPETFRVNSYSLLNGCRRGHTC
jgi:Glycosyl hydrolase family 12